MSRIANLFKRGWAYLVLMVLVAAATAGVTALLINVSERKAEQRTPFVRLVEVDEDTTDPAKWGKNWPKQYDTYKLTAQHTKTRYGGHGGSEALPEQKIERDPWLKRMFLGYAFSIDYRDRRGHAYMLQDQEQTERTAAVGSPALPCVGHASVPQARQRDAIAGFRNHAMSYQETNKMLHDMGHAHGVLRRLPRPQSMALRDSPRPSAGHGSLASGDGGFPTCRRWMLARDRNSPTTSIGMPHAPRCVDGLRQCHVEYYCSAASSSLKRA